MRILNGTKVIDAEPGWREALLHGGRRVVIDLGAGDGRFAYESARNDAASVYVAVDPDAAALAAYAFRACRKPARGGVANAHFVVAAAAAVPGPPPPPPPPGGGRGRGLLQPEPAVLRALASLAKPGGRFQLVLAYDPQRDSGAFTGEPLPVPDETYIDPALVPAYGAAGPAAEARRRPGPPGAAARP